MINGCAAGSLLIAELGSFASRVTPTYSEWSVTPAQSSGVSDFHFVAHRMLDWLALKVLVCVTGIGDSISADPRIEGPTRVNMCLAEIRIALRVLSCAHTGIAKVALSARSSPTVDPVLPLTKGI